MKNRKSERMREIVQLCCFFTLPYLIRSSGAAEACGTRRVGVVVA